LSHLPDCTYTPGQRKWKFNSTGDQAYKDNTSDEFYVNIYGSLNATMTQPNGTVNYTQVDDSTITFKGYLYDEDPCNNPVTDATVRFNITNGTDYWTCDSTPVGDGNYTCDWPTSGKPAGWYNVTMVANKSYYNDDTDNQTNAFYLFVRPFLTDPHVIDKYGNKDIASGGWGRSPYNYTINVTDDEGDQVNVSFWLKTTGSWIYQGSQTCQPCDNIQLTFNRTFTCSNSEKTWFYKFNATDQIGSTDSTSETENSHYVTRDNILMEYISGNETNTSLTDPTTFILRVYDIENGTYELNPTISVSFNVTKQGKGTTNYTVGTNTTNGTGYVIYSFLPDTSFQSKKQDWSGFTSLLESCYNLNTSNIYNVTTQVHAPQLENETVDIITGGWGDTRNLSIQIYDQNDTAEVYLWRSSAISGPWSLIRQKDYTTVGSWEMIQFIENFSCPDQGTWYFKFNATDTFNNTNSTIPSSNSNFTLTKDAIVFEDIFGNNSIANRNEDQRDLLYTKLLDANGTTLINQNTTFYEGSTISI
jgi:hypothetical protein